MLRCKYLLLPLVVLCLASLSPAQNFADAGADRLESANGAGSVVRSNHVVVVMEENRSINYALEYMPYLASLASQYSEGMQVYSDSHGSWLAYGELTSGIAPRNGEARQRYLQRRRMHAADQYSKPGAPVRGAGKDVEGILPVHAERRLHGISTWSLCAAA